ncbi:MAG TPA: VTC domain-containing protein, partial [Polyangiaceae bacterium]
NASNNLKLRLREYSEVQEPSSALVTEPTVLPPPEPWLWLELKQREGSITSKRRIRVARANAACRFVRGRAVEALSRAQEQGQEQRGIKALLLQLKEADEPLEPSVLVSYRRQSFQADEGQLRVTIDRDVAYHRLPASLTHWAKPLVRSALGAAVGAEPRAVVEIKRRGSLPSWLDRVLLEVGAPAISFSKFVAANEAVHGAR